MIKKTIFIVLIITVIPFFGFSAEHIAPPFLIDTETAIFMPIGIMDVLGDDGSTKLFPFAISQDITFVHPGSSLGLGLRTGYEQSNFLGTQGIPVLVLLSVAYNLKIGAGITFLQESPTFENNNNLSDKINTFVMSFSLPMLQSKGVKFGIFTGVSIYTWTTSDSFYGDSVNFNMLLNLGVSLSFKPVSHIINRILFPEYTKSFD